MWLGPFLASFDYSTHTAAAARGKSAAVACADGVDFGSSASSRCIWSFYLKVLLEVNRNKNCVIIRQSCLAASNPRGEVPVEVPKAPSSIISCRITIVGAILQ